MPVMTADTTLPVRSPADLIAAVPYLLGFHPADSLTVVALRGAAVTFTARHDLPPPGTPDLDRHTEARQVAAVVARQDVDSATVIGHGPPESVTPAVRGLARALRDLGIPVLDELRVTDGRFWSYLCPDDGCCPPEGSPCDAGSVVAAAATYAGQVALPDRQGLADRLAPVTGAARASMAAATARAAHRLAALTAAPARPPCEAPAGETGESPDEPPAEEPGGLFGAAAGPLFGAAAVPAAVVRAGRVAVRAALRRYRDGGELTDDEVAWLGVLLTCLPVRDHAWERVDTAQWQVRLWTDVLRRVDPAQATAPACLLSFAAWRAGDGALAWVAVERARRQDPDYAMAALLDDVLRYALPPSAVDDWPAGAPRRRGRRVLPRAATGD